MTVVAGSSSAPTSTDAPERGPSPARLLLAGLLAALRAFVVGVVLCVLAGLLLALGGAAALTPGGVVGTGCDLWLAAHHVPIVLGGDTLGNGTLGLLPLGLLPLPALLLARAGRRLAAEVRVDGPPAAATATCALAVPYAAFGLVVALSTLASPVHAVTWQAPAWTAGLALLAGGVGVVRGAGLGLRLAALLPGWSRPVLVGTAGALAALVATAAALVAVLLAVRVVAVRDVTASLHAGGLGGVLLFLAGVAYLPNAVLFALAYAAGPGFALGGGTVIAPWRFEAGPVPAFPLLGALPAHQPPAAAWLVLAAPAAAGVLAGTLLVRHTLPRSLPRAALWGLAPGPVTGLLACLLSWLAGGSLGAHRLAAVGPAPLLTGAAVTVEVAVLGALAAVAGTWLLRRALPIGSEVARRNGAF